MKISNIDKVVESPIIHCSFYFKIKKSLYLFTKRKKNLFLPPCHFVDSKHKSVLYHRITFEPSSIEAKVKKKCKALNSPENGIRMKISKQSHPFLSFSFPHPFQVTQPHVNTFCFSFSFFSTLEHCSFLLPLFKWVLFCPYYVTRY